MNQKRISRELFCINLAAFLNSIVFYSISTLLPLYLTDSSSKGGLGMEMGKAFGLYGSFFGFSFITPLIGGFFADLGLGKKMTLALGYFQSLIALYLLLFHENLFPGWAFLFLALGYGFIRTAITSLVALFAAQALLSREKSYKIFYLHLAYGFTLAALLGGYLYTYFCFKAMLNIIITLLLISSCLALFLRYPLEKKEVSHDNLPETNSSRPFFSLLLLLSIPYFVSYVQMTTSMSYYLHNYVGRTIRSFEIPTVWINGLSALVFITLAGLSPWLKRGKERNELRSIAAGMLMTAIAFAVLSLTTAFSKPGSSSPLFFFFIGYGILGWGDMLIRPKLFSAASTHISLKQLAIWTGLVYVTIGLSIKLGSLLAAMTAHISYCLYFSLFVGNALLWAFIALMIERKREEKGVLSTE